METQSSRWQVWKHRILLFLSPPDTRKPDLEKATRTCAAIAYDAGLQPGNACVSHHKGITRNDRERIGDYRITVERLN